MAKTVFNTGTVVTPAFLNALQALTFDDLTTIDGHYPKITNAQLSDAAGDIKTDWTTFRDTLKVSAGSGLSVSYNAGAITLDTGLVSTIAAGTIVVPDNSTTYVYVDRSGTVTTGSTIPAYWNPLAQVTTVAGAVTAVVDLRQRYKISPLTRAIQTFGSGGYEGDLTVNAGQTVTVNGLHYYRNITIATGGTVNVTSGWAYFKASGTVSIQGTINVTPPVSGGVGFQSSICNSGFRYFGAPGSGLGRGAGINQSPALAYPYTTQSGLGSGGAVGFVLVDGANAAIISSSQGGAGGGAIFIEAAGAISIAGSITCNGGNATVPTITGTTTSAIATGGSGGSGGTIWLGSLTSISTTAAAILSAKGGNGSSGTKVNNTADSIGGGGGGGGGYIVFFAPSLSINVSSQLLVTGGSGGLAVSGTGGVYYGSCAGASFGGTGGANDASNVNSGNGYPGASGQLLQYSFTPV